MIRDLSPKTKAIIALLYLALIGFITILGSGREIHFDASNTTMIAVFKVAQVIGVVLIFILPAVLFTLFFSKERIGYLRMNVNPGLLPIAIVFLLMLSALPLIAWTEHLNQQMKLPEAFSGMEQWMKNSENYLKEVTEAFMANMGPGGLVLNLFVIAFMAGLSEEIFFRGILQRSLVDYTKNIHAGIWIAAILFSAFHMQFYGFIPRALLGAVLGYMYVWSGSIWLPIWAHFVNNGTAVVLIYLEQHGTITTTASEEAQAASVDTVTALISVLVVGGFLFLLHRVEKKRNPPVPAELSEPGQ